MEFLANLLSGAATASAESKFTLFFTFDEPECPKELL